MVSVDRHLPAAPVGLVISFSTHDNRSLNGNNAPAYYGDERQHRSNGLIDIGASQSLSWLITLTHNPASNMP
jgi:hypothetical protein